MASLFYSSLFSTTFPWHDDITIMATTRLQFLLPTPTPGPQSTNPVLKFSRRRDRAQRFAALAARRAFAPLQEAGHRAGKERFLRHDDRGGHRDHHHGTERAGQQPPPRRSAYSVTAPTTTTSTSTSAVANMSVADRPATFICHAPLISPFADVPDPIAARPSPPHAVSTPSSTDTALRSSTKGSLWPGPMPLSPELIIGPASTHHLLRWVGPAGTGEEETDPDMTMLLASLYRLSHEDQDRRAREEAIAAAEAAQPVEVPVRQPKWW